MHEHKPIRELAFLPDMVDGEILYSWTGHYHRLSGNGNPIRTSMQIFGNRCAVFRRNVPSHLDHFVAVTIGVFGDVETLAYERSQFGFFAPFKSVDLICNSLQRMKGNYFNALNADIGLHSQQFRSSSRLKACPDCMSEDMKKFFITKWYLEHQWPASWICRKHSRMLLVVKKRLLCKNSRYLLLPQDISKSEWEHCHEISQMQIRNLKTVISFCASLARRRHYHLNLDLLRFAYLLGAKRKGWVRQDGTLVVDNLWEKFKKNYQELDGLAGLERGIQIFKDQHFILRPMRRHIHAGHPISHFLLMPLLFDSPSELNATYEKVKDSFREGGMSSVLDLVSIQMVRRITAAY